METAQCLDKGSYISFCFQKCTTVLVGLPTQSHNQRQTRSRIAGWLITHTQRFHRDAKSRFFYPDE